ncbi:MAG: U32 family peptidase C-terminal domain-containing protein [Candidatus Woesebacteria bacterium]|jgi:putative protease
MADFKVGKVTHYYDKIEVAIIELDSNLSKGDKIKFVRGGEDLFEQTVESMQVEHEKIETAKKGDVIGLKVDDEVKEGAEVYKLS